MHGNVHQWCDNAEGASRTVLRGGSFYSPPSACRAATRFPEPPSRRQRNCGLRLARVPVGTSPSNATKNRKAEVDAAGKEIDFAKYKYQIVMETTLGKITLDLLPEVAPRHCKNMLSLAKIGYYDGLIFHRVIKDFVIQGGSPDGTGEGGPGYGIDPEFNSTLHEPGVLSMARSDQPDSAGSQFFICLGRAPGWDGKYTAFGRTADAASLEVVKQIGNVATGTNDRPKTPVTINKAIVVATKHKP